ncbi:hypothetical protein AB3S75_023312 [Citrus x aurantiifolia]
MSSGLLKGMKPLK